MNNINYIRLFLIFCIFTTTYLIIIGNLYRIQIKRQNFFKHLADQQYTLTLICNPPRALIFDRCDIPLALNKDQFSVFIQPHKITSKDHILHFLEKHFPASVDRFLKNPTAPFLFIKRRLNDEQLTFLKNIQNIPVHLMKEPHRWYPMQATAHLIGITDIDNKGIFGIEALFDEQLSGKPTTFTLQKDARSGAFYFDKKIIENGKIGKPVHLTIDSTLQFLTYEYLKETVDSFKAQEGAVLIIDPATGEILVMAQYPVFDPNNTSSLNLECTKNRILTESYEFGSVMKAFTALAALDEKVVHSEEIIDCQNCKVGFFDGFKISTWKAHDQLSFSQVIELSNNFGIAAVAKRLGKKLYAHYRRLGFGTKTPFDWYGQQSGTVNHPSSWSRQSIISLSFGYEISATLMQLGLAFCLFARQGVPVIPYIVKNAPPQQPKSPIYSSESITTMRSILEKTVSQGTAHRGKINGYTVMGKTGTANMVIDGRYNTQHNTYTFAGIIEKEHYARVIVTFIKDVPNPDSKLYASAVAVPLFEKVAEQCILHEKAF